MLETFLNFISSKKTLKEVTLQGLRCNEHYRHCERRKLDLSQHSQLTKVNLDRLPPLQLNITTPSLVDVELQRIDLGESSLLLSPGMLNIKRVKLSHRIGMSAESLQNNVKVLEHLPQSVTVEMDRCYIEPETERERFRKYIRSSQTFHVTRDYYDRYGGWIFEFNKGETREEEKEKNLVREVNLPSQNEVNRACHENGRHSKIVWDMCTIVCEHIRGKFEDISSVWPAYKLEDSILSVIFMVVVKKKSDLSVLKDYNCELLLENETNDEGKRVASKDIFDIISNGQSYADTLKEIRVCINKNADDLFTKHSNLNAILPSLKKSKGYFSGVHDITVTPCIALYVRSKGFIPLNEEPFKEKIGDFQIDVLEGIFTPFTGRATDYHAQLKIGLAIHGRDSNVAGTLGGFVEHSTHGICGITCAHVLYDSQELTKIKESGSWHRKEVHQPFGDLSEEFGHVVEAVFHEGNDSSTGVDVALIKIMRRHPQNGSFPLSLNDVHAGFDDHRPLYFNSGEVCAASDIDVWSVVVKFGMVTGITRGVYEMQGAALRQYDLVGQNQSFGYFLKDQFVILKVGNEPFAVIGDSGSLVMMKGNQDSIAIGLVEGGLNDGRVLVTPICDILRAIGCTGMNMCQFRNNNENITSSANSLPESNEEMEED